MRPLQCVSLVFLWDISKSPNKNQCIFQQKNKENSQHITSFLVEKVQFYVFHTF